MTKPKKRGKWKKQPHPEEWLAGAVVLDSLRHVACRLAVLTPVLGPWWLGPGDRVARVRQALLQLRGRWLGLVRRLGAERWSGFGPDHGGYYLRTCPPFGVYLPPRRACGRRAVCPFCYARQAVRRSFDHLEHHLEGHHLVEFLTGRRAPCRDVDDLRQTVAPSVALKVLPDRRLELKDLGAVRGAVVQRLWPEPEWLQFQRGGLLLLRRPPPPSFFRDPSTVWRYHPEPTRTILAEACGRVLAYPAPLLTAPADRVVALMEGLHRRRLLSFYGTKYTPTEEPDVHADGPDLPEPVGAAEP